MKFALVGDVHLADKAPSLRTETYAQDILAKLQHIVDTAKAEGCAAIVQNGDMFHIKSPVRTSHQLVQSTAEVLTSAGLPVIIVPGNHDVSNDRMESLRKQPLGTLAKATGIELLMGPHKEFPLFGIPYLHDWGLLLPRHMDRYRKWADANRADSDDFWPLLVTHAPIFPPGEDPPYEYISGEDWATMMENGDCSYGHIHDPHGAYKPAPGFNVTLSNFGAISRGSLHEATLKRKPAFAIWDGTPGGFTRHEIPHRPVEAVFRMEEKEDVDEKQERAAKFLDAVGSTTLERLSLEQVAHRAHEAQIRPATRQLVLKLLEDAQ